MMSEAVIFFFNDTATTEIYTLSLHDALPILKNPNDKAIKYEYWTCTTLAPGSDPKKPQATGGAEIVGPIKAYTTPDWRSEEHTSELQSRQYLVCRLLLEKKHKTFIYSLFNMF